jgi:hypothetical protein
VLKADYVSGQQIMTGLAGSEFNLGDSGSNTPEIRPHVDWGFTTKCLTETVATDDPLARWQHEGDKAVARSSPLAHPAALRRRETRSCQRA